ncbi:MAG: RNA methyltransferase [Bacteroidales bacterium]|nr:RNA methyltransferase [Bacteroidales bacterium]
MLSHNQIKFIQSLKQIKFRKELELFVAEGPKIVKELPGSDIQVKAVYALEEWLDENKGKFEYIRAEINRVTSKELERISNLSTPNKVLAVCHIPERDTEEISDEDGSVIALDGIRDPGNLGTIIRTADWFGIRSIICSDDCVDAYNPKVVQSTMGSIARVKVYYADLDEYLSESKLPVYATVMEGSSIWDAKPGKGIYVIGNESKGIRAEVLRHATYKISIPSSEGGTESLNAAVATGIIMAIATRE